MLRPTLGLLRNSRLPSLIGECAGNIGVLRAMVNEAQQRLLEDPLAPDDGWFGGWATMVFNVTVTARQGYITTPRDVARLIGINVCNTPVSIKNGFYEYLEFKTGLRSVTSCCNQKCQPVEAFERDSVATLTELVGTKKVQVYATDSADIGQQVIIQGLDQNGIPVTDLDTYTTRAVQGETVMLALPFATTVNEFTKVTGILKPPTIGRVTFFAYDSTTAETSDLSSMDPGETTADYRRYYLSGLPNSCYGGTAGTVQVTAQVKLDLVPAMSDRDYLLIQSIPAIIEECQALRYGSMDSQDASKKEAEHHAKALRLLFGQLDAKLGKVNTAISVPIFGSDRLQRQVR